VRLRALYHVLLRPPAAAHDVRRYAVDGAVCVYAGAPALI
jgi:hypothetical protein